MPTGLLVLGGLLFALLALHEQFSGRLALPRAEGSEAVRKRLALGAAAVVCFVLASALFLLAVDIGRWSDAMAADDVRYRAEPESAGLWQPDTVLPFGRQSASLGTGDDVAFREALQGAPARPARPRDHLRPGARALSRRGACAPAAGRHARTTIARGGLARRTSSA